MSFDHESGLPYLEKSADVDGQAATSYKQGLVFTLSDEHQCGQGHQDDGHKFGHSFGHRWAFLVPDGPPLALPRSVLPATIRYRPDLNRSTSNFDRQQRFFSKQNVILLDPSRTYFTPLDVET